MKIVKFWWLQSQAFYKKLHLDALELSNITTAKKTQKWADIGCGTGLMSDLAIQKGYFISSFDKDKWMIKFAKAIHFSQKSNTFYAIDVMRIEEKFDVVTAVSLLSVVDDKQAILQKLDSLLNNSNSKLIIIEPTELLTRVNVVSLMKKTKRFYHYKHLYFWAKAREGKAIKKSLFDTVASFSHYTLLDGMIRVSVKNSATI